MGRCDITPFFIQVLFRPAVADNPATYPIYFKDFCFPKYYDQLLFINNNDKSIPIFRFLPIKNKFDTIFTYYDIQENKFDINYYISEKDKLDLEKLNKEHNFDFFSFYGPSAGRSANIGILLKRFILKIIFIIIFLIM